MKSVLIILTLLQSASKDAVYCSEGQIKKTGRKKSAWMKWFVDYNSQHIIVEFWFTLKKKPNTYTYTCIYKSPQEDILRSSVMAESWLSSLRHTFLGNILMCFVRIPVQL